MRILHMLVSGGAGGIESLCADIAHYSVDDNYFYFFWEGGNNAEKIKKTTPNVVIRKYNNRYILREYRTFRDYLLDNKIDCIVVQGMAPVMLVYFRLALRSIAGLKGCLYLHSNSERLFSRKWVKCFFKYAYKRCDGCIAISESVRDSMKNICDTRKIHVIYNGTDCQKFKVIKKEKSRDVVSLLYVGRLIKEKGVSLLFSALHNINIPFQLTIVGGGEEKESLEKIAHDMKLSDKVRFVGEQWNIEDWMAKADVFVHPATCKEGFGITLIEAMAAGIPCVAFRNGGIPEIITNNVDGYLVDEISEWAYLRRLKEVVWQWENKPEEFAVVAQNAIKRAEHFDIRRYVIELAEYLKLL